MVYHYMFRVTWKNAKKFQYLNDYRMVIGHSEKNLFDSDKFNIEEVSVYNTIKGEGKAYRMHMITKDRYDQFKKLNYTECDSITDNTDHKDEQDKDKMTNEQLNEIEDKKFRNALMIADLIIEHENRLTDLRILRSQYADKDEKEKVNVINELINILELKGNCHDENHQ